MQHLFVFNDYKLENIKAFASSRISGIILYTTITMGFPSWLCCWCWTCGDANYWYYKGKKDQMFRLLNEVFLCLFFCYLESCSTGLHLCICDIYLPGYKRFASNLFFRHGFV